MMTTRHLRYPGVRPFETSEKHLFFGRSRDIEELYDLILLERLTVLFAKSGYGKSSLLKAGVIPRFTDPYAPEKHQFQPLEIRLGTYVAGKSATPLQTVVKSLESILPVEDAAFLNTLTPGVRLWHHLKMRQPAGDTARFLLVFDQFEEFFSYPEEEQAQFRAEIAELLYEEIPQDVRLAARSGAREQRAFLATPFDAKVLFSIRADRLSLLDGMKDYLPAILNKRYELQALDVRQAREAIVMPASLPVALLGEGAGPEFGYSEDALEKMLGELSGKDAASKGRIEAFQLQIVCASIEKRVNERGLTTVTAADLPDFDTVYEDYYQNRISELPDEEQLPARRVLEDGLLLVDAQTGDARRLSRDSAELSQSLGIAPELLKNLERTYLIRRELNTLGGYNYEISHDTLIAPMLKSRKAREATLEQQRKEQERLEALERAKAAEEKAREETARRAEAERLQEAAEKAKKRANVFALGVGILAILAAIAFFWANRQSNIATEQRRLAEANADVAVQQKKLADSSAVYARQQEMRADTQKNIALTNAEAAQRALENMQRANDNLVEQALLEAAQDINGLHYEAALSRLTNAAALGRKKPKVADALLEIAYFFNESGQQEKSRQIIATVAALMGKGGSTGTTGDRAALRSAIQRLSPARFEALKARYYPVMVVVKGSGSVSGFKMAKTETTVWQYNLFLNGRGKDMLDESTIKRPGWGWEGNNPVVFVSWYDAVEYANWLSTQLGLAPVYTIDREQKDADNISDIDKLKWTVTRRDNAGGFRLPSEAEWEYAAHGGPNKAAFEYAGSNQADEVAWHKGNSGNRTRAVATGKKHNGIGLYDLSGNVWEWCWDWNTASYGRYRVVRGGSWKNMASAIRISDGGIRSPDSRDDQYGFRVVQGL